jgi:thiosulfate reductase cytochrome b subunit
MSEERIYHYPVWIRLWHLLNALFCLFLIATGISMQFSNPEFPMIRFDIAVTIHNVAGVLLIINYILFFTGNLVTSNGRNYRLAYRGYSLQLYAQFWYYTRGLFRGEPVPFPINRIRKFNPLQQLSYAVTMYIFVPLVFITGLALMYPDIIPTRFLGYSGLHVTDLIHIISAFLISIFMIIHIYFCTIGKTPSSNFKSMINGYTEIH